MASIYHCTVGMAATVLALQMLRHCGYSHLMRQRMSRTLSSGFFWTQRQRDSLAGPERIPFS